MVLRREVRGRPGLPLAEFRSKANISLEQIVSVTKISKRFLEAIEAADYRVLPGGVFNVNYIRQYAAAVGYNAEEILDHYYEATGQAPQAEKSLQHTDERADRSLGAVAGRLGRLLLEG